MSRLFNALLDVNRKRKEVSMSHLFNDLLEVYGRVGELKSDVQARYATKGDALTIAALTDIEEKLAAMVQSEGGPDDVLQDDEPPEDPNAPDRVDEQPGPLLLGGGGPHGG